jgi:hypothetical protein
MRWYPRATAAECWKALPAFGVHGARLGRQIAMLQAHVSAADVFEKVDIDGR